MNITQTICYQQITGYKLRYIKIYMKVDEPYPTNGAKHIRCLTLNYGGILDNPFQFYSENLITPLTAISTIFEGLIKQQYFKGQDYSKFQFKLGKIQKKLRKGRYSPEFQVFLGVQEGKFINRETFDARWDQKFQELMQEADFPYTQQEKNNTRTYDFINYHTLLKYVYGNMPLHDLLSQNPLTYSQKLAPFYLQSFLDSSKKLQTTCESLNKLNPDIIFIQQYQHSITQSYQKRQDFIVKNCAKKDKSTIIRRGIFQKIEAYPIVHHNIDILLADKYLIVNAHLASKPKENAIEIKQLQDILIRLRTERPDCEIILGGDLNSFLSCVSNNDPKINQHFRMFPADASTVTTIKKRTMAQSQYQKGNQLVKESKDKILSTLEISKARVILINGQQLKGQMFIPSNQHPFDHFAVIADIILKK